MIVRFGKNKEKRWELVTGVFALMMLVSLVIKLSGMAGGIILSGLALGGIVIICIVIGALIVAGILQRFIKKMSFLTLFFSAAILGFICFHFYLYSPKMTITVPKNYTGPVNLVRSTVQKDILTVDTNGTGYVTDATFKNTNTEPKVVDVDGNVLNDQCVGFSPSTFWGQGQIMSTDVTVEYLTFEIDSKSGSRSKQYNQRDLLKLVDRSKLKTK